MPTPSAPRSNMTTRTSGSSEHQVELNASPSTGDSSLKGLVACLHIISSESDQLHASNKSGPTIFARPVFGEFLYVGLVLLGRTDAWRNGIPQLLAIPRVNHSFQMTVFKLVGLFRSKVIG